MYFHQHVKVHTMHLRRVLTEPSACSFMMNFLRLKQSLRIFAHENELILVKF